MAYTFKVERYFSDKTGTKFTVINSDHTPHNRRKGERKATATLEIINRPMTENGLDWLTIELSETVSNRDGSGRWMTKTIAITVSDDIKRALIAALTTE